MKALVFERVGDAREVLTLREMGVPEVGAGQVLVAVEASPIHPADFGFVRGAYRIAPVLPQVAGLSGAGRVVAVGAGANVTLGTRVAFRWPGAWAELAAVPVARLFEIPPGVPSDLAAQFPVNPLTAWGLLEMASVAPGAWLALTAANSSVARLLSVLALERGARVIGITREASLPLAVDVAGVAENTPNLAERVRALTGAAGVSALVDPVGGALVSDLFPALRQGATIVTYGTLSSEPIRVSNATLVYSNLTWLGFGIDRWYEGQSAEQVAALKSALWAGIARGTLPLPVLGHFGLPEHAAALGSAAAGGLGKLIFRPDAAL